MSGLRVTKTFAATALLQLVAEGRVVLDAPVVRYLPGRLRNDITIRHLLRHESGLPEYFEYDEDPASVQPWSASEVLDSALGKPHQFEPGTAMVYTNTNYIVVGMVIEAVTGRPATQEITGRIIDPLGLADTYFPALSETGLRVPFARGYEDDGNGRRDVTSMEVTREGTAGALVSTGEDATTFITALLDGRLLPPAQLTEMMDTVPQFGSFVSYGLGLGAFHLSCGVTAWGHAGDLDGYHSLMVKPVDGPALSVTLTQSPHASDLADDPRAEVAEALYC